MSHVQLMVQMATLCCVNCSCTLFSLVHPVMHGLAGSVLRSCSWLLRPAQCNPVTAAALLQVHEFGHHIHNLALSDCVANAANVAHAHAASSGAYTPGRYMVSSVHEYMANAVAAWFQVGGAASSCSSSAARRSPLCIYS
jgi:hypothetical protein